MQNKRSWQPRKEHFQELYRLVSSQDSLKNLISESGTNDSPPQDFPQDIINWLARLTLLYGIPFDYLVPNEKMLPVESIRFFYIDPLWINSLIDGACSIGRENLISYTQDGVLLSKLKPYINQESRTIRLKSQNKTVNLKEISNSDSIKCGFLLRSVLVSGWQGLEISAYKNGTDPVQVLRMERLSSDVLLCIFDEVFDRIEIKEPGESMHFGFDESSEGKYSKMLRGLGTGGFDTGVPLDKIPAQDIDKKIINADRVVDIAALASTLKDGLDKAITFSGNFSSAEFAVQMIENAHMAVFTAKDGKNE